MGRQTASAQAQTAATGKDAPFQAAPHAVPKAVERRSKPHLTPWGEAGKDLPMGLEGRFQALWKAGVPEERGGGRGGKGGEWGMGNGEWGMGNGEWGTGALDTLRCFR
ncbi:MAG: hypothetical protein MdMp014T_0765 [Treponematales bacterium]